MQTVHMIHVHPNGMQIGEPWAFENDPVKSGKVWKVGDEQEPAEGGLFGPGWRFRCVAVENPAESIAAYTINSLSAALAAGVLR
jgi:hypothetical protein